MEGNKRVKNGSFQGLGLSKELLNGISRLKYNTPTPIQRKTLPLALAGVDCVCMARTGSGKTAAFLIPMIARLQSHVQNTGVRGLVLSPTRELAVQTLKFCKDLAKFTDLRVMSVLGGDSLDAQFTNLSNHPDILIATPGRMAHLLREISTFTLKNSVKMLVFDEADRLFEMGFADQLHEIMSACPQERQTLLFSATMPKSLLQFSRAGLRDPQLLRLDTDAQLSQELRIGFFTVRSDNEKLAALLYLVKKIIPTDQSTIVFTATRHHSELLQALFERIGVKSTVVYGAMAQDARDKHLRLFRAGSVRYLIVTDLAARGIDVPLLNNVINFHFPASPKLFVHRCGRAARQGRIGFAFSIVEPEELPFMIDVHNFLGKKLDLCDGAEVVSNKPAALTLDDIADDDEDSDANGDGDGGGDGVGGESEYHHSQGGGDDGSLDADDDNDAADNGEDAEDEDEDDARSGSASSTASSASRSSAQKQEQSDLAAAVTANAVEPYTLSSMTPHHVHVGMIPQDLIDQENDFVLRCVQGDDSLAVMRRISENGMKQYRRTRVEPSRNGLKCAKDIMKSNLIRHFHPLIAGCDPEHCSAMVQEKNEFVRMLQTFRPAQTVFETGIGTGTVSTAAMAAKATAGSFPQQQARAKAKLAQSTEMMRAFRKASMYSLERNRKAAAAAAAAVMGEMNAAEHDHVAASEDPSDPSNVNLTADEAVDEEEATVADIRAAGVGKARLSITARKKLKKKGLSADAMSKLAKSKALSDECHPQHQPHRTAAAAAASAEGDSGCMFQDEKYFMSYGDAAEAEDSFKEESMQPHSSLRGSESLNALRMDNAMLDISPDDAMELNKKRKMLRWDAKKRKFVKQTLAEMAESKSSGGKRIRSESGVNISHKSKHAQGELYEKWKKRTRREVGGEEAPDFEERPNFKHNRGVQEEVRSAAQVRQAQEKRRDLQLKNMPKDKRKKIEAALRKKKQQQGQKADFLKQNAVGMRRKAKIIVRT